MQQHIGGSCVQWLILILDTVVNSHPARKFHHSNTVMGSHSITTSRGPHPLFRVTRGPSEAADGIISRAVLELMGRAEMKAVQ